MERYCKGRYVQEQDVLFRMADALIANGLSQVENYSFMDKNDLKKLNFPEGDAVYASHSDSEPDFQRYPDMLTSLFPGLMHTLS